MKYDSDGALLWKRRYKGSAGHDDSVCAMAIGQDGSAFVTGQSKPADGTSDYLTIKYGPDGTLLWARTYDGLGHKDDEASALALDSIGNVCVTGRSVGLDGSFDMVTVKYDMNGDEFWDKRYAGVAGLSDAGMDIYIDERRSVYVAGNSNSLDGSHIVVIKYDSYGKLLFQSGYDTPSRGKDFVEAIDLDPVGNIYVAGWSSSPTMDHDIRLTKFDAIGNLLWTKRYAGAVQNGDHRAYAMAQDRYGKIYLAGTSMRPEGSLDYVILKADSDGSLIWRKSFSGRTGGDDRAEAIALDDTEGIYVTGQSEGSTGSTDFATLRYSQPAKWEFYDVSSTATRTPSIAIDKRGLPHLCYEDKPEGSGFVLRYAFFDGTKWQKEILDSSGSAYLFHYPIAVDSQNHVHVAYYLLDSDDIRYLKYAHFDGIQWSTTIVDTNVDAVSMTMDREGHPHVAYVGGVGGPGIPTARYARFNGKPWIKEIVSENHSALDFWTSIAVTSSGKAHIMFLGSLSRELFWAANMSGAWEVSPIGPGEDASLAIDNSDNLHVVYGSGPSMEYGKYDGSKWIKKSLHKVLGIFGYYNTPRIAVDSTGTPHVAFSVYARNHDLPIYGRSNGRRWTYDVIEPDDSSSASVFLDSTGVHLGYISSGMLKYARSRK